MKLFDVVTVPDRCKTCPHILSFQRSYDETSDTIQELVEAGLSGAALETMAQQMSDVEDIPIDIARSIAEQRSEEIRRGINEHIDEMDEDQGVKQSLAEKFTRYCEGPLDMSATRLGRQVVVTVCMSEVVNEMNDEMGGNELTIVKRTDSLIDETF